MIIYDFLCFPENPLSLSEVYLPSSLHGGESLSSKRCLEYL